MNGQKGQSQGESQRLNDYTYDQVNISDGIPHYIFEQVIFKYGILVGIFSIDYKNFLVSIFLLQCSRE